MLLIIKSPVYHCEPDKDHFFAWLEDIPAIKEVTGSLDSLELIVEDPIDKISFYELVGLLTRYGLDRKCLRPLCKSQSDPWFNDPQNYWYSAVFEEGKTE